MKVSKSLSVALTIIAITAAGSALAGPPVTVTFKNVGNTNATYKIVTSNEASHPKNKVLKVLINIRLLKAFI